MIKTNLHAIVHSVHSFIHSIMLHVAHAHHPLHPGHWADVPITHHALRLKKYIFFKCILI